MQLINLKENKEYVNKAIDLEKENYEQTYISNENNVLNYCLIENNTIYGEIDYSLAYDTADILFCYITKENRGKGLSKELLNKSLIELKNMNVKEVYLEVRVSNIIAYNLYKKLGFIEVGKRKKYYSNNEDAIIMRLDL